MSQGAPQCQESHKGSKALDRHAWRLLEEAGEEPELPMQKCSVLLPTHGWTPLSDPMEHQPRPSLNKRSFVRCVYCRQEIKPKETRRLKGLGP